jgi:hypothetical protein
MKFYGQSLIENGAYLGASGFLASALKYTKGNAAGKIELLALIGRSEKELFQKSLARGDNQAAQRHAQASFDAYQNAYEVSPTEAYYPLINMTAIADLARGSSIRLVDDPDPIAIARKVTNVLCDVEAKDPGDNWVHATRAEANIALGDWDAVEESLQKYLVGGLTPFQHEGTLRQFRDVWRLEARGQRGKAVLAMLKAQSLWDNRCSSSDAWAEVVSDGGELSDIPASSLEKMLGADGLQTYDWWLKGVRRAQSVAAVLTYGGRRIGTSFVVSAERFGLEERANGRTCLMTNFHVLNENGEHSALSLEDGAKVRFEAANEPSDRQETHRIGEILFQSPLRGGLDCTIFAIEAKADTFDVIPIDEQVLPQPTAKLKPRCYIIGYPLGGEMQFSVQDNRLLDHECWSGATPRDEKVRLVHYFSPTEPGNSGSPVFDGEWNCVALHHAGKRFDPEKPERSGMRKLNGKDGRYSANQGIWMGSIVEDVQNFAATG